MPDLKRYRAKRDSAQTPEPFGEEIAARELPPGAARAFVVQQHAARNMHWDLRLEIDGVLVSWAVPKGPSLDPAQKRLAVRTEDHPLEYAHFEGVIPADNYGAGAMIVWDCGAYRSVDGNAPAQGLEQGKLDLFLEGHKLRGRFALVRSRDAAGRQWLLLRKGAAAEEAGELTEEQPASVFSGLRVEELREGVSRDAEIAAAARSAGAPQTELDASQLRPMLATREASPFSRKGWLFELKYDGVRVLASRSAAGDTRLRTRTGADRSTTYPEVLRALRHLPLEDFVIDGELVALDESQRDDFERIQRRFTQSDPERIARLEVEIPVVLYAFDLLGAAKYDLRGLPLLQRKQLLARVMPRLGQLRFADHVEGDGEALFEAARTHGLEGIVAKRADSRYETGRRSSSWCKVKVPRCAELVIVGIRPGRGSRRRLGALLLAWHREGELVYAGSVGSGLDEASIEQLLREVADEEIPEAAFQGAPQPPARGTRYLQPRRVCEVGYSEVTKAGSLRHPVFLGLREDSLPTACQAPADRSAVEQPAATAARREAAFVPTRLEKIFWPIEGYTKGDLLAYYEAAWPWLEAYLCDRPVVLTRYPDGIEGKSFYQKNAPDFTPDWARRENIEGTDYFLCDDLRTLLYVINSGAIPLHVWSARLSQLERPDWLLLDLDPKQVPFEQVVRLARHIHGMLQELGATHFVKTSGQDGLHILLPLAGQLDHAEARSLAEALARTVCAEQPEIATVARPLAARADKVYVDYLQNGRGKLVASPLSVRPRPGAPVSMPLRWSQVTARLDPRRWTIRSALRELERRGDPLVELLGPGIDVSALLEALARRLESAAEG